MIYLLFLVAYRLRTDDFNDGVQLKETAILDSWPVVRLSRVEVMPLPRREPKGCGPSLEAKTVTCRVPLDLRLQSQSVSLKTSTPLLADYSTRSTPSTPSGTKYESSLSKAVYSERKMADIFVAEFGLSTRCVK